MDVVQGDFVLAERLPDGSVRATRGAAQKQFLDPEIANEGQYAGQKIILSDGEQIAWNPPVVRPNLPDLSKNPALAKYFNREGFQTWPCWFYHPSEKEILIKDAKEAHERFGIHRRKATDRERALYNTAEWVWDTPEDCLWRPQPYPQNTPGKFDPNVGAQGKNYMPKAADPQIAQNALLAQLIPTVTAAVVAAMQNNGGSPAAPAGVDATEWDEFQRFLAFKKASEVVAERGDGSAAQGDDDRAAWEAKAKEAGIRVDGRWSLDKLRKHVLSELERLVREAEAAEAAANAPREGDLLPGAMGDPLGR